MKEKVQLYVNSTKPEAVQLALSIKEALISNSYSIVENNGDIVIGFGGDGTLLHFLRQNNYNVQSKYIGINCGTLGFLQDFNVNDVCDFIRKFPLFMEQQLRFIEIEIEYCGNSVFFKALNEFIIQDENDKTFRTTVNIHGEFLENYVGTGMIFSTPTGSTALNLSAGGCIVHPNIEAIQVTPREAIANSKIHCLSKSICIPKGYDITLLPTNTESIKIYSDGEKVYNGKYDKIRVYYSNDRLIKLTNIQDNFIKTIREKLI